MRETKIEKDVVQYAKDRKGIAYKFTSPNCNGVPDRLVLLPLPPLLQKALSPYMFFVECKAPGKKLRPLQTMERNKIRNLGYNVKVIDYHSARPRP